VKRRRLFFLSILMLVACGVACQKQPATKPDALLKAYDVETDDAQHVIPLNYEQAQGKRLFYRYCVWCHADATPAGPSNRSNLNPTPPRLNDGSVLNAESDESLTSVVGLGGSAMGKSSMMPPYGQTLKKQEIQELIAYMRAIAQPPYSAPAKRGASPAGR
jgi:mono/diheme cytochrome c family protein